MKTFAFFFVFAIFGLNAQDEGADSAGVKKTIVDTIYLVPEKIDVDISVLTPPNGFVKTDKFNGYVNLQNSSAIIITLITNVNYLKLDEGMTEEFYKTNGLTYIAKSKVLTKDGSKGLKYTLSFKNSGIDFVRYMVYIGDANNTIWLNYTFPEKLTELLEEDLNNSIESVKFKTMNYEKL